MMIAAILIIILAYLSLYTLYILFLAISNYITSEKITGNPLHTYNDILTIVPAHNEELLIDRLLKTLTSQKYPDGKNHICVVADNCDDRTADMASQFDVRVLIRKDSSLRGKGYAINHALKNVEDVPYDAILIVDADSTVNKDCLQYLNILINNNQKNIQLYNAVGNPYKSALTTLMNVSRSIANEIIGPAKSKLGLSFHLMGNGMCFTRDIIGHYGWDSFSVGEDWEFFSQLIQDGHIVYFAKHAKVYHQESQSLKQATPQRLRWSSGRFQVLWNLIIALLKSKKGKISLRKLDAMTALIFPNPSLSINLMLLCLLLSWILLDNGVQSFFITWILIMIFVNISIFVAGCFYTERPIKSISSFFFAPLFLGWKLAIDCISILGAGRKDWRRTSRIKE